MSEAFPDAASRDQARGQIISNLEVAYHQASNSETDPRWFNPRGPMAGLAQSAMNQHAQSAITAAAQVGAAITSDAAVATAGGVLPAAAAGASAATAAASTHEPFGAHDPGWIECIIDGFATALRGKARFVQHQSLSDFLYPIPDQVTIALVSDWGANNHAAALISDQIRAVRPDIVIHLGDIYYAGQRNEALAMLKLWPLGDKATGAIEHGKSFALNGNHEMFSGGHAYFETVLKAFGQPASYFGFRNSKWQILAFDSAYIEHRLLTPQDFAHDRRLKSQWDWLVDKMKNSKLPTILLSHHQPVSAFLKENTESAKLRTDYHQFATESGRHVFGWFFGHEHRCTIYDDVNIPYFARLIGNGCIPHTPPIVNQKPDQGCYSFSKTNTSANAKGSAMSGFALLKFAAADIDITYINEDGNHFHQESWHSPQ